ncbi:protein phosphatase 2C domain-containing protein [Actinomadura rubrisoli]|uniref:Serine/threonine protein phosphatase n=1 Tax=Actinomadura rubrisoli TaxID=2530368 RepID=A0A4R5A1N8_9ACTN|nr:protein phosphatase 2C domain-containing protein [Actinomadura rubrisoli]TDD64686.1 serine/threonine protein phosphatase [Actinomadura rubrisoli]
MTDEQTGTKAAELSCPTCGEIVYAGEKFCEECGHRLDGRGPDSAPDTLGGVPREGVTIKQSSSSVRSRRTAAPVRPCTGCGGTAIDADGYCENCGLRQPADRDHVEIELPAPGAANGTRRLAAAGASDRGLRYSRNEDALALLAHSAGIATVVSDGVGSSQRPEDASRAAADTGAAELAARLDSGEDPEDATRAAALKAAEAVAALAASPSEAPSCTYVSAVTHDGSVTVGWVGDSRAYWLAADEPGTAGASGTSEAGASEAGGGSGGDGDGPDTAEFAVADLDTGDMAELGPSRQLTEDDSWAAIMVAEGALTEAEAEAHPNAHVITAWLGADAEEVRPHVRTFRPAGPGTLLVCSDGLWNYFPAAADLAALLAAPAREAAPGPADGPGADPLGAARTLVRRALDAGGRDNITVAVIPLPSPATTQSTEQER